jgi:hypothetical protein
LALCVDIGVYFGEVLRRAYPSLRWELWTRKTVEHNKPVILGFPSGIPLDPVGVTVTIALGFATREREETALLDLFDYWSAKVVRVKNAHQRN